MDATQEVVLKNGSREFDKLVSVTMLSLKTLITEKPTVFYDLVMKCRDSSYKYFGNAGEDLQQLGLAQNDGSIHDSIKNIVLSAVSGDDLDMTLASPLESS